MFVIHGIGTGDLHHRFVDLPTACEVLVRVLGSSVNPADRGAPSGPSVVMGADIAGRVVAMNGTFNIYDKTNRHLFLNQRCGFYR